MKLRNTLIVIVLIVLTLAVLDVLVITHLQVAARNVDITIDPPEEAAPDSPNTTTHL